MEDKERIIFTNERKIGSSGKQGNGKSKYQPIEMTDESVYLYASHWFSSDEIARMFNTQRDTMMHLHGAAYHAGKQQGMLTGSMAARKLAKKILSDFNADTDESGLNINFARSDAPTALACKAIEMFQRHFAPPQVIKVEVTNVDKAKTLSEEELNAQLLAAMKARKMPIHGVEFEHKDEHNDNTTD